MTWLTTLHQRARQLKAETWALALAVRDSRTPWYAKLLVAGIVAYACSPIDLIPDFVPVLGYLDDLVLLPLGIAWALRLIPPAVLIECRVRAQEAMQDGEPVSWVAGTIIVILWLGVAVLGLVWFSKIGRKMFYS
jgi:uncharacterized membrane protein YkvA (DUF1232 family)